MVELVYPTPVRGVVVNGRELPQFREIGDFDAAEEGFIDLPDNRIRCKTGVQDITRLKTLWFEF
jgi:hypothetical protein